MMETRTKGLFRGAKGPEVVDLFAYSTNGVPGLEIVGPGKTGKTIKEKFIYISKERKLLIPLKRYIVCVEAGAAPKDIERDELAWLEFPMLLLFWAMSGNVALTKLEDCLSSGRVFPTGKILQPIWGPRPGQLSSKTKIISEIGVDGFLHIPSKELLAHIPALEIETISDDKGGR